MTTANLNDIYAKCSEWLTAGDLNDTYTQCPDGFVADGEHVVTVVNTVTGCTADPITFQVDLSCFGIPNFFTPDGDGTNDTWYPKGIFVTFI